MIKRGKESAKGHLGGSKPAYLHSGCKCDWCGARRSEGFVASGFGTRCVEFSGGELLPPPNGGRIKLAATAVPEAARRKATPIASGVLAYFPDALAEVARVSKVGNDQHNPGEPLHWAKEKSTDELDALARHLTDRLKGEVFDTDGVRHLGKVAWRALAALQRELDASK
jgi:hypothetical protein